VATVREAYPPMELAMWFAHDVSSSYPAKNE
jgi:hypothetical protein